EKSIRVENFHNRAERTQCSSKPAGGGFAPSPVRSTRTRFRHSCRLESHPLGDKTRQRTRVRQHPSERPARQQDIQYAEHGVARVSQRFKFSDYRELFAKANEEKSGDQLAGIAARSERE